MTDAKTKSWDRSYIGINCSWTRHFSMWIFCNIILWFSFSHSRNKWKTVKYLLNCCFKSTLIICLYVLPVSYFNGSITIPFRIFGLVHYFLHSNQQLSPMMYFIDVWPLMTKFIIYEPDESICFETVSYKLISIFFLNSV